MSRFTKPAPKPESRHSSAIRLELIVRKIGETADYATGGSSDDIIRLAFATQDERLRSQIENVRRSHSRHGIVGSTIEVALTRKGRRTAIEGKIITAAIRKDQGGKL